MFAKQYYYNEFENILYCLDKNCLSVSRKMRFSKKKKGVSVHTRVLRDLVKPGCVVVLRFSRERVWYRTTRERILENGKYYNDVVLLPLKMWDKKKE